MKKHAYLIAMTQNGDKANSSISANIDIYKEFLSSCIGGGWDINSEIEVVHNLTTNKLQEIISNVFDYKFIYLCGHGEARNNSQGGYATYMTNANGELRVDDINFNSSRQTIIVETCRKIVPDRIGLGDTLFDLIRFTNYYNPVNTSIARSIFNYYLEKSTPYIQRVFSASLNEVSGYYPSMGGKFTLELANQLVSHNEAAEVQPLDHFIELVKENIQEQTPTIYFNVTTDYMARVKSKDIEFFPMPFFISQFIINRHKQLIAQKRQVPPSFS